MVFIRGQDQDNSATFYFPMICVNCMTWLPVNKHMLESKFFRHVRLYQIVQSEDNQIQHPSITAKRLNNL